MGNILELIGTEKDLLNRPLITQALRSTTNKLDLRGLKSYRSKDTIIQTKWQGMEWECIFTNDISDRGLISKMNKELQKIWTLRKHPDLKKGLRNKQRALKR